MVVDKTSTSGILVVACTGQLVGFQFGAHGIPLIFPSRAKVLTGDSGIKKPHLAILRDVDEFMGV